MPAPAEIIALVERFAGNIVADTDRNAGPPGVIDPFFTALGWDLDNVAGHAKGLQRRAP